MRKEINMQKELTPQELSVMIIEQIKKDPALEREIYNMIIDHYFPHIAQQTLQQLITFLQIFKGGLVEDIIPFFEAKHTRLVENATAAPAEQHVNTAPPYRPIT